MQNPIKASPAVTILCNQFIALVRQEQDRLCSVAFETDKLDPKDGWLLDIGNAQFVMGEQAAPEPPTE